jgi:amidase
VIAKPDGLDPRQRPGETVDYLAACSAPPVGLRIGRVKEGFDRPGAMQAVNASVDAALERVAHVGAEVRRLSVPLHAEGLTIWMPVILMGTLTGLRCDGASIGLGGLHMPEFVAALSGWQRRSDQLSDVLRVLLVAGQVAARKGGFAAYALAQNLGRDLAAGYEEALVDVDVLAMPTTPAIADPLPGPEATIEQRFALAVGTVVNTAPFDLTGHPAITIPCGRVDGLPAGLMLIARRGGEAALYRAASAIEASSNGFW